MKVYSVKKDVDIAIYSNIKKVGEATGINYFRLTRAMKSKGFLYDGVVIVTKHNVL